MAASDATSTILKLLTGVQAGVDVVLLDGDYTLGSGDDDDIQVFDVSLKPGHAKLRIRPGTFEVAGAAGELRSRNGVVLEPQGDFQEIEPLDILSAGTTRFALGPRNGNWASIVEANDEAPAPVKRRRREAGAPGAIAPWRSWYMALPVAAVLALIAGAVWLLPLARNGPGVSAEQIALGEVDNVRRAVNGFDFGKRLGVNQEVDGVIYVTGFVETPVQRRAILAAVRNTDVPARIRLQVLEAMRGEIAALIADEKVKIGFDLSPTGQLTLTGTVLDPAEAARITSLISDRVTGLSTVVSQIRTAPSILADVKSLARRSQIEPLVLLRLDNQLIEASGVLPTEKIDPWVGFLQAYSTQFADLIPLRSLVRLQNPDGTLVDAPGPSDRALLLGQSGRPTGDLPLDVSKLKEGKFKLGDVFVGQPGAPDAEANANAEQAVDSESTQAVGDAGQPGAPAPPQPRTGFNLRGILADADGPADGAGETSSAATAGRTAPVRVVGAGQTWTPSPQAPLTQAPSPERPAPRTPPEAQSASPVGPSARPASNTAAPDTAAPVLASDRGAGSGDEARRLARRLIGLWRNNKLPNDEQGRRLRDSMNALEEGQVSSGDPSAAADPITVRYAALLADAARPAGEPCWPGSKLSGGTVAGALFWLDLLSVSRDLSLTELEPEMQPAVLDAALNPGQSEGCAARSGQAVRSVYVHEVDRNPAFVRFVTRMLPAFPLDVAGADISRGRYIQTRDGRKMREGAAPDENSRLAIVGELGLAVERSDGYATVIFGQGVNWLVR